MDSTLEHFTNTLISAGLPISGVSQETDTGVSKSLTTYERCSFGDIRIDWATEPTVQQLRSLRQICSSEVERVEVADSIQKERNSLQSIMDKLEDDSTSFTTRLSLQLRATAVLALLRPEFFPELHR